MLTVHNVEWTGHFFTRNKFHNVKAFAFDSLLRALNNWEILSQRNLNKTGIKSQFT